MSEFKTDEKAPRSDLSNTLGKEITLFLREPDKFKALKLDLNGEDGGCLGRLVGVERVGLWFEPQAAKEAALSGSTAVPHFFIGWDDVLSIMRNQPPEDFVSRKEYRGLRPTA